MSIHEQIRVGYHVSPSSLIICMHCVLSLYFISLIMASAFLANWSHMMWAAYCNYSNFMSVGLCACKVHFISSICFHFYIFLIKKACDWMNHAVLRVVHYVICIHGYVCFHKLCNQLQEPIAEKYTNTT